MDCSDFQDKLDQYLDRRLDAGEHTRACTHVRSCRPCDQVVTSFQKTGALLRTAAADRAAAVDVSGLWDSISSQLDLEGERRPAVASLAAAREARTQRGLRVAAARAIRTRIGQLVAVAAAAVVAFVFLGGERQDTTTASGAIAQSRPVRIESMEVAEGHRVSTWVKPRIKTRVIWVADAGDFAVQNALDER